MISIATFYKNIIHEMRISLNRMNMASLSHQDKLLEAIGLVMLSTIGLLPLALFIITVIWVLS